jgi:hypothetical protein
MNLVRAFLAVLSLVLMHGYTHLDREAEAISPDSTVVLVDAAIHLDPDAMHFDYGVLVVSLYEYDRRLADVAALLVDSRKIDVSYASRSDPFSMVISLGSGRKKKQHKSYYVVAEIKNRDGARTHYGYKNGTEGFAKVLEGSSDVKILLRQIGRR